MKKSTIIMAITAIFFCFFTGCASIGDVKQLKDTSLAHSDALGELKKSVEEIKTAVNQQADEPRYDAYKLRPQSTLGQPTTEEISGTDKEILAAIAPQPTTNQTGQTIEDRVKNLEDGMMTHTARLASYGKTLKKHEERFEFIDERLKEAGVLKIEKADGWEFGDYESDSAELTDDMKSFIKETVNGLKILAVDLEKKGEKIVLVFKSFTDRDGSKEVNERLQKDRSRNCQKEFLAAIAAAGIKVETRIIPGENSERSITGKYDRYTLVMMKKESAIPITAVPAAPAAKTTSHATNPA